MGFAKCQDCGIPYSEFGLDLVLPNQQWEILCPNGGILCANCICKRAIRHRGSVILAWVDNMTKEEIGNHNVQYIQATNFNGSRHEGPDR